MEYEPETATLLVPRRRTNITGARAALNGYQKGHCFYCYTTIDIASSSAMAHAVEQQGPIEFDEVERLVIDQAAGAADRAEILRHEFNAELASDRRSSVLTRLSAEARQLDRAALDLARSVAANLDVTPKSDRHVRAVRARWDRTPRHA